MTSLENKQALKIAIVAGEASGDILGAGLIAAIKKRHPNAVCFGVGGEKMLAQGFDSWFPMERLAVMGLIEPLKRLFELLSMRKTIRKRLLASPPDVFIGIDAPDFNLNLELALRKAGIKVVHYVSPSVWAWRQGRITKITRAVDLMLTLFPFEERFYQAHDVKVCCVGHTLADAIPMKADMQAARVTLQTQLALPLANSERKIIALLPGSRASEVRFHARLFLQAASHLCAQQESDSQNRPLYFLIPAANEALLNEIKPVLNEFPNINVELILKHSQEVMAASDAVLLASGTTALEAMLLKKPMIVAYRMSGVAFAIFKRLVKVKWVSLPNLLADKTLVPELLQSEATPEKLANAMRSFMGGTSPSLINEFEALHQHLKRDANEKAAQAVLSLIGESAVAEEIRDTHNV